MFVAYSNDSIARSCQQLDTCAVIDLLSVSVVRISLELDEDAFASTVKVHDEAVQHVLPAKPQPEYAPIAQQRPRMTLGGSRPMAQRASERESLRRSETTERIHDPRMPRRLCMEATRIPRRERKTRGARTLPASPLSRRACPERSEGERGTGGEDKTTRGDHEVWGEDTLSPAAC